MSEPTNPQYPEHPDLVEARRKRDGIANRIAGAIVRRDTEAAYALADQYARADQQVVLLWMRHTSETGIKGRLYPDE